MSESSVPAASPSELQIPLSNFVTFVRQLSHDLRNHLNAAELQSAFIAEIAEGAEVKEEVKRLRGMVSQTGAALQALTTTLGAVKLTLMPYPAGEFMEDFRQKFAATFPERAADVTWQVSLPAGATLEIDPQLLQPALLELFANAFTHSRGTGLISVTSEIQAQTFALAIREPKTSFNLTTSDWGREPLRAIRGGHYGLGLHRTRTILEAHDGKLDANFDSASSLLVTTVRLPVEAPAA